MKQCLLYIHGKGGSAGEAAHYRPLFPDHTVIGLDYASDTPWDAGAEIREEVRRLRGEYDSILLVANSIGAFFAMHAGIDALVRKAFFISPIVDMEKLICDRMAEAHVTETQLKAQGTIPTSFGEDLSWDYLCYVRAYPIRWTAPTAVLYGSRDGLTSYGTMSSFAERHGAQLTVMEGGEHWFHTKAQMVFLDAWITDSARSSERE
ncbi:MAG: alpha/beta hydrolase [Clostridia bacterium]|nr:alpha/beta hydrolase [Clostridia bacterium]